MLGRCIEAVRIGIRCVYWLTTCVVTVPTSYIIWAIILHPLSYFCPRLYWKIYLPIFRWTAAHYGYFSHTAGFQVLEFGVNASLYKDRRCLLLPNHQAILDNTVMLGSFEYRNTANKSVWLIYGSPLFKWNPIGLGWRLHGHFFVTEGRSNRSRILQSLHEHIKRVYLHCKYKWIVIFPEGGFLQSSRAKSQQFAAKYGFPHLENVLLPRTSSAYVVLKGCEEMGRVKGYAGNLVQNILDVTIAYPNGEAPTFTELLCGTWGHRQVHVYYRSFKTDNVPLGTEEQFRDWLFERWTEKDAILKEFYCTGKFPEQQLRGHFVNHSRWTILAVEMFFAVSFYVHVLGIGAVLKWFFACLFT